MKEINKKLFDILVDKEIEDDIAGYCLYSNDNKIDNKALIALINGYDFRNQKWYNSNDRKYCVNSLINYLTNDKSGRNPTNNQIILSELKEKFPNDF